MQKLDEILEDRGLIYGDFGEGIKTEVAIMSLIETRYSEFHGKQMPMLYKTWISKYAMKLSRLAVSPMHIDSHRDIGGYAELICIELTKEKDNA